MKELQKILLKKKLIELRKSFIYGVLVLLCCAAIYFIFFFHIHSYSDWEIYIEPSCTKNGFERRECRCGEYEQRMLDKLEHISGDWVINEAQTARELLCSVCGKVLDSESYTPHIHSFEEWETVTEPKCGINGLKKRTCECGEAETDTIDPLQHTEGAWVVEGIFKRYPCIYCGEILRTEELKASEGLWIENGVVLGRGNCTDSDIIIPSICNGEPITEIASRAFEYDSVIESVYFPESIKKIGKMAFNECSSLECVTLMSGIEEIGARAFYYCTSLKEITLPSSLQILGARAFSYCSELHTVYISPSVNKLDMWTFSYCTELSSVYFDGTEEAWLLIPKDGEWDLGTVGYTVYCTDGDIEK